MTIHQQSLDNQRGLLKPSQIRGNHRGPGEFREFPKAIRSTDGSQRAIVGSPDEEAKQLAAWNIDYERVSTTVSYPRWMFHAEKGGQMVRSLGEENALGPGWYDNPNEAVAAAKPVPTLQSTPVPEPDERAAMLAEAEARGIKVDGRWNAERIKAELAKAA